MVVEPGFGREWQMEWFAHNDEVARLDACLPALHGMEQCRACLTLAWYLRQQAMARSLQLADQVEACMRTCMSAEEVQGVRVRLQLIRCEAHFLQTQDQSVHATLVQALQQANDPILQSDCHALLAFICGEIGDEEARRLHREQSRDCALQGGDAVRAQAAELAMGFVDVLSRAPRQNWDHWLDVPQEHLHPVVNVALNNLIGVMHRRSNFVVQNFIRSFDAAMQSGQLRAAIVAASNIGDHLNEMNEHEAALEWNGRALDLARPTGWSGALAVSLLQMAATMRYLGRFDTANDLLRESLQLLQCWPMSRNYAIGLLYLGELALDSNKNDEALEYFNQLQQRSEHLQHMDFQALAQRGRAHSLLRLGQPVAALAIAHQSWRAAIATRDMKRQIEVLKVLAEIHSGHDLPDAMAQGADGPVLYYLELAHQLGCQIDGYIIDAHLYDALASEYARLGRFAQAYEMARQGAITREKTHTSQATQRAIALQIRYQTERAQAEGARQRQLAEEEARHVALLQQTRNTLEHLDAIGKELTAELDLTAVFRVLERHVRQLIEVHSFAVYLRESTHLVRAFAVEDQDALPVRRFDLADTRFHAVRCLHQNIPLMLDWEEDVDLDPEEPDTVDSHSALYAPLAIAERVLGVMGIQSIKRHAFGEREQLIFHTLCSYAAIALDNANAYKELLQTQAQLVEQEKLAAMGGLVAGVAHELNTPLGNCLMMSSSLQQTSRDLLRALDQGTARRQDLTTWLDDAGMEIRILARGLSSAINLVSSFSQVVVDRQSVVRQNFDLLALCHDLVQRLAPRWQQHGHRMLLEIAPGWRFDSYPVPLAQVLTLLIENALQHAFSSQVPGEMVLRASSLGPGRVRLEFLDNGQGIVPEHVKQVFDPFFTTRMGQGSCGLGLSIVYNVVHSLLGGSISVRSQPGQGTCFKLDLPLSVSSSPYPGVIA